MNKILLIVIFTLLLLIYYCSISYEYFNTYDVITDPFPRSPIYKDYIQGNPNFLLGDLSKYDIIGDRLDDYLNLYNYYDNGLIQSQKCNSNQTQINQLINDKVKDKLHESILLHSTINNPGMNELFNTFKTPFSLYALSPNIDIKDAKKPQLTNTNEGSRECKTIGNKVICDVEYKATCGNIYNRNNPVTDEDCSKGARLLNKGDGWKYNPNSMGFTCTNDDCSINNIMDLQTCCMQSPTCGSIEGGSSPPYSQCDEGFIYDKYSINTPCEENKCTSDNDKETCCIDELDNILRRLLNKNSHINRIEYIPSGENNYPVTNGDIESTQTINSTNEKPANTSINFNKMVRGGIRSAAQGVQKNTE